MRAMLLCLLAACYDHGEPVYEYDCRLIRTCNEVGHATHVVEAWTVDEVRDFAAGWTRACQAITQIDVEGDRCDWVLCWASCSEVQ